MAYSKEVKNEVKERLNKGEKPKEISEQMKISLTTVYKWQKEEKEELIQIPEKMIRMRKVQEEQEYMETPEETETRYKIKELVNLKRYDEAIKLTAKYPNNVKIQSQRIKILIKKGKVEEAKEIGYRKEFENDNVIQSQMITLAIKENNYEEAKRIGYRKEFENVVGIQSQMIKLAIIEENYEEAKRIGYRKEFENVITIQSQMITVAIKENNYEEAKRIGSKKENENNYVIQLQMRQISRTEKKHQEIQEQDNMEKKQVYLNQIKAKLYYDKITESDIEEIQQNTEISEYERNCILLAIYEKKKNEKRASALVKEYKRNNPDSEYNKTFNAIMQRIINKKIKIFDYSYYDELLHWEIDSEIKKQYEEEQKEEFKTKIEESHQVRQQTTSYVFKRENDRFIGDKERFMQRIKVQTPTKVSGACIEEEREYKERIEPNYYNEVLRMLKELRIPVYIQANSKDYAIQEKAIEQLDKMEILIDKVEKSKDDKEYINYLYKKIMRLKANEQGFDR